MKLGRWRLTGQGDGRTQRWLRRSGRAGLLLLLLGGLYAALWWGGAALLQYQLDRWQTAERAAGSQLEPLQLTITGFPGAWELHAGPIRWQRADGLGWQAEGLRLQLAPWWPFLAQWQAEGLQRLALPVAANRTPLIVSAAEAAGSLSLAPATTWVTGQARLTGVTLAPPVGEALLNAAELTLELHRPLILPAEAEALSGRADLSLSALQLPLASADGLGRTVERLSLTARLLGPLASTERNAVIAWSGNGGRLALDQASLVWGPLATRLQGSLSLDHELQPQGALDAEIRGALPAIEALRQAGWLSVRDADAARMFAKAFSRARVGPGAGGGAVPVAGEPVLVAPLSLRARHLWFGPLKLMPLPLFAPGDWLG